jgi:hypothetical protein
VTALKEGRVMPAKDHHRAWAEVRALAFALGALLKRQSDAADRAEREASLALERAIDDLAAPYQHNLAALQLAEEAKADLRESSIRAD